MNEWIMIMCMGIGGCGFSIGGTGPKWVRRYIMPLLLGLLCFIGGVIWWKSLAFSLTLLGVLHLGYGDKTPYWRKILTFIAYILPTLFLGFTYWQIITPIAMLVTFKLSNSKFFNNIFVWKICEFIWGSMIGITVASLIRN